MAVTSSLIILQSENVKWGCAQIALSFKRSEHLYRVFGLKLWNFKFIWFWVEAILPGFWQVNLYGFENIFALILCRLWRNFRNQFLGGIDYVMTLLHVGFKVKFSSAITLSSLCSDDFVHILLASILLVKWIIEKFGSHRTLLCSEFKRALSSLIINFLKSQPLYDNFVS